VAVPVNVHRVNWLWVNPKIFKQAGAKIPATWEEFDTAARKIQQVGFIPVAHGGQPWQEAALFEDMVLAVGGADFYRKAFVELNSQALDSPTMVKAFEILRTVKNYTDKGAPGRDWNQASALVINGKAAMQFMGDWAKGEFSAAGQVPGKDYLCVPAPGTQGMFIFNIDSFVMFRVNDPEAQKAQREMARLIMEPEFQERFNLTKGSIPVRLNTSMEKFDTCARAAMDEFVKSTKDGNLVPSMSQGMATFPSVQGAIYDVVTEFYNSAMSPEDAAKKLVQTVEANR
jgi:glucose/mannose transport system substrate-binding protein